MRGYFGIGVEGISKEGNLGNLARSAHAFGASFFFTIDPALDVDEMRHSDTSGAFDHVPYYQYDSLDALELPAKCDLVAIEFTEDSINLPSFRHPTRAAYVLGPEMGSVSLALMEKCAFTIKIPMKFCINVGVAGAIVMYDRLISSGQFQGETFSPRPVKMGGPEVPFVAEPPKTTLRRKVRTKKLES